jgi:hypothetical protein
LRFRKAFQIRGVIPAKAGIQFLPKYSVRGPELDSRLRGNDGGERVIPDLALRQAQDEVLRKSPAREPSW